MINQLTVFLQNKKGRMLELCKTISDFGVNMHAFVISETLDYGVARIICDKPEETAVLLRKAGFRASTTDVFAVRIDNKPGGLYNMLFALDEKNLDIEYAYCFKAADNSAVTILKTTADVSDILTKSGYDLLDKHSIYSE